MDPTYITQWQDRAGYWRNSSDWPGKQQKGTTLYAALAFADMVTRKGHAAEIIEQRWVTCQ